VLFTNNVGGLTLSTPIIFGKEVILGLNLMVSAGVKAVAASGGAQMNAAALFGDTLKWGGIDSLTLAEGTPVTDFSVASDSGFDYKSPALDVVPEPDTLMLLVLGCMMASWLSLRKG